MMMHNAWGDHDENVSAMRPCNLGFQTDINLCPSSKNLNSKLNREVAEFELAEVNGAHRLDGETDVYMPSPELSEADAHMHILGGDDVGSWVESAEERRRRILSATMSRISKQEEELEQQCGTGRAVN
jgi:hypothetical protein